MDSVEQIVNFLKQELSNEFENKINYILSLIRKYNLSEEEKQSIRDFVNTFIKINNVKLNSTEIKTEDMPLFDYYLAWANMLINECYIEPSTQAKLIILNEMDNAAKKENFNQNSKSVTRNRLKNGIVYYDYPNVENEPGRISGFANTVLILVSVMALGIVLAFIAL